MQKYKKTQYDKSDKRIITHYKVEDLMRVRKLQNKRYTNTKLVQICKGPYQIKAILNKN